MGMTLIELWAEKKLLGEQHEAVFAPGVLLKMGTIEVAMDLGVATEEQQAEYVLWLAAQALICARMAAVDRMVRVATGHGVRGSV